MDTTMVIFWAVAFVVFLIAEIATLNALVSVWFAVGALAAMFCAMADISFVWQMAAFVITSTVVLIATRPFVKKVQGKKVATNYELDVGKQATVIENINNDLGQGRVRLDGTDWSARSENGDEIFEGTMVTVTKVDGSKLIVKKI
ncbi:MAG: NfeD family protein [Ruminococcus sp.]|nr:NfeD family protein [Ruminococcus sp.]